MTFQQSLLEPDDTSVAMDCEEYLTDTPEYRVPYAKWLNKHHFKDLCVQSVDAKVGCGNGGVVVMMMMVVVEVVMMMMMMIMMIMMVVEVVVMTIMLVILLGIDFKIKFCSKKSVPSFESCISKLS